MIGEGKISWPIGDMAQVPVLSSRPYRGFTWQGGQGHRPGLEHMVSTGRKHGFESLEERRLLVALDFLRVSEALSQPFELNFEHADGRSRHIPDFLALVDDGMWLLDVRPLHLIKPVDALKFAASREVAAACGWRYSVVAGWPPHVWSVLDHLSSRRRPMRDRLGLEGQLRAGVEGHAVSFGELVESTSLPVVARAHATGMLWRRELGVDLGSPLFDSSLVWASAVSRGRL